MPSAGLEPAWVAPYAPQTYVSTNSTTTARGRFYGFEGLPDGAGAEVPVEGAAAGAGDAGAACPAAGGFDPGAGAAGAAAFGAAEAGRDFEMTEPFGLASMIDRIMEMATKPTNAPVVTLWRNVVAPRAPKAVWLDPPPNAPAMSAPFPCWRRTTRIRKKQMMPYRITRTVYPGPPRKGAKCTRPSGGRQARAIAANDSAERLAPPIRNPSVRGAPRSGRQLSGVTEPP